MELLMHERQSLFSVKDSCLNAETLEIVQDIRLDMNDPGLCCLHGIRVDPEG